MEHQYIYSSNSSRLRKPHKLRVKRYNAPSEISNDAGPPSAKKAAHQEQPSSNTTTTNNNNTNGGHGPVVLLTSPESPTRRTPSRKLTPSRIKHYGEKSKKPTSPVPLAQAISGGSSDDSSSDEIAPNGTEGSFPSVTGATLPPHMKQTRNNNNQVAHNLDEMVADDDGAYEHVFVDDDNVDHYDEVEYPAGRYDKNKRNAKMQAVSRKLDYNDNNNTRNAPPSPSKVQFQGRNSEEYVYNNKNKPQANAAANNPNTVPAEESTYAEETYHSYSHPVDDNGGGDGQVLMSPSSYEEVTIHTDGVLTPGFVSPRRRAAAAAAGTSDESIYEEETIRDDESAMFSPRTNSQMSNLAALANMAAAQRKPQIQGQEEIVEAPGAMPRAVPFLEHSEKTEEEVTEVVEEEEPEAPISAARRKKREMEQQRKIAGALAAAAQTKKDNLQHAEIQEKPKPAPQEPVRAVQLKPTPKQESAPPRSPSTQEPRRLVELRPTQQQQGSDRAMELREKKRAMEARVAQSRRSSNLSKVRLPEKEYSQNIDVYSGQVIQPNSSSRGLSDRSSMSSNSHRVRLPEKKYEPSIDIYSGQVINQEPSDSAYISSDRVERGIPGNTNDTQQLQKSSVSTPSRLRLPAKKYPPNIDIYTGLPIGDMSDSDSPASDASESDASSSDSSSVSAYIKIPIRRCCWCCLFILLAAVAAYLLAHFYVPDDDDESSKDVPSIIRTQPPMAPTTRAPAAPPTFQVAPTAEPLTMSPAFSPADGPPNTAPVPVSPIDSIREMLIFEFPTLEESFQDTDSPQYLALDWIADNAFIASYSDERIKQRFALATLYYSTGGGQWVNKEDWLSDRNECQWYSASSSRDPCNQFGAYTNLELDLNDLSGTIPPELALLSDSLKRMDFTQAGLGPFLMGSIPYQLGMLTNLEFLSFKGNFLTGFLPPDIGNWQQLAKLDLSNNSLFSTIPSEIGQLTAMTELYLQENRFDGALPSNIGDLTQLSKLDLAGNRLEGPLPSEIGNLVLLQDLNLASNGFTSLPSEIGMLRLVKTFHAQGNEIAGSIPTEAGDMISIVSLDLSENALTGQIPSEIGNMLLIQNVLDLSNNELSGTIPPEIGQLLFLRNLLLYNNQLTGQVPASVADLARLNTIRLESNNLTGTVPEAVCAVFNDSYPIFVADCLPEEENTNDGDPLVCPCCMYCCRDGSNCQCQFESIGLSFLCTEFDGDNDDPATVVPVSGNQEQSDERLQQFMSGP